MGKKARNYSAQTLKKLFGLSGNQCSFPGCIRALVNEDNAKDSNICHIEGANDEGERYREDMTDSERAGYNNLILLCVQHHDETNDVDKYDVASLQTMKQAHVARNTGEKIRNNPSMLKNTVNAIAAIDMDEFADENSLTAFNITEKLEYNNVIKNAPLIQEYKVYHHKINALYDELEAQGSLKKNKILTLIRNYYIKAKGAYSSSSGISIDTIRLHADEIIDDVLNALYSELEGGGEFRGDIISGVDLIAVDAFMRCKILENPQ
jgi:C-terminal domain 10 of the ABC-three component (ABC-3C) systems